MFGSFRSNSANNQLNFTHPLLSEPANDSHVREHQIIAHRIIHEGQAGNIIASLEDVVGPAAVQLFQQILNSNASGAIVGVELPAAGLVATVGRAGGANRHSQSFANERPNREPDDDAETYIPSPTANRWNDEMKITQGSADSSRVARIGQNLIAILLPAAHRAREALEAEEARRKQEEEEKQTAELENEGKGAPLERAVTDIPADGRGDEIISDIQNTQALEDQSQQMDEPHNFSNQLVDYAAHAMEGISVTDDAIAVTRDNSRTSSDVPASDIAGPSQSSTSDDIPLPAGPSRIYVQIRGTPVDITDTGIDPAFLEALPDEMREEVLAQQLREQRNAVSTSDASRDHLSQINPEFLDALPPEIRAELLEQEADQVRRRVAQAEPPAQAAAFGPVEMDSATFLASLDPALRQVVLMEQDETFLETLPPELLAEATHYREIGRNRTTQVRQPREQQSPPVATARKLPLSRDAIHLLDRTGVATLIRLLFYPQVLKRNTLQRVLINLCENAKTRTEVYNSLLTILLELSQSVVDDKTNYSSSQRIYKNGLPSLNKLSPARSRMSSQHDAHSNPLAIVKVMQESGLSPQVILSRCIETLNEIASASELAPIFFTTEQEQPSHWRKGLSKRGKGKEKLQPNVTYYPLALLLDLLSSSSFLRNSGMMDTLVALLAIITKPLSTELPKEPEPQEVNEAPSATVNASVEAPVSVTEHTRSGMFVSRTPNSTHPLT